MQHLLDINQLSRENIETLLARAMEFKYQGHFPHYPHHTLANLFYENSTRTRISFEMAAKHLLMPVINVDIGQSSENKGEIIADTLRTLVAMGISHIAIRHKEDSLPKKLAHFVGDSAHIINAGDGQHAHPSQALLDLMTIVEQKPDIAHLKIAIIGNIRHSRVANSLQCLFKTMAIHELVMIAPAIWQPKTIHFGRVTADIKEGLKDADVIICLRVQRERLEDTEQLSLDDYRQHFALTKNTLSYAKNDAMVLHPGPINRDIEIDSDVADGPHSFILHQVKNGVFMRMAILESLA